LVQRCVDASLSERERLGARDIVPHAPRRTRNEIEVRASGRKKDAEKDER
jgi:hypothetical protein